MVTFSVGTCINYLWLLSVSEHVSIICGLSLETCQSDEGRAQKTPWTVSEALRANNCFQLLASLFSILNLI